MRHPKRERFFAPFLDGAERVEGERYAMVDIAWVRLSAKGGSFREVVVIHERRTNREADIPSLRKHVFRTVEENRAPKS